MFTEAVNRGTFGNQLLPRRESGGSSASFAIPYRQRRPSMVQRGNGTCTQGQFAAPESSRERVLR